MIVLGVVSRVTAGGVFVTLPGSRGAERGPYETLARVSVADRVALQRTDGGFVVLGAVAATKGRVTSADIEDGTIVDADVSASAALSRSKISGLPTSSTDNTVPRFDGTGGALQTSGVVVDDNNRLRVASGSSGGLEIGSSGPLALSGTGGPSGISAPVGSTWRQTDANATHGSLTGLLWNKVGTGTAEGTDWLVDFEGRWISWAPTIGNITQGTSPVRVAVYTRRGKEATFDFMLRMGASGAVTGDPTFTLPVARTQTSPASERAWHAFIRTDTDYFLGFAYMSGGSTVTIYGWKAAANVAGLVSVSTLPGPWTAGNGRFHVSATYEIE